MAQIFCDNRKCKHNIEDECTASVMHYVGRLCRTFRRIRTEDVMQPENRVRCQKRGGKYKADSGRVLK